MVKLTCKGIRGHNLLWKKTTNFLNTLGIYILVVVIKQSFLPQHNF